MQGYIKIDKRTQDNSIWTDSFYLKLWMFCLFRASHKGRG